MGTEQILLGLIGESTGIAAKVLKSMGVNLKVRLPTALPTHPACVSIMSDIRSSDPFMPEPVPKLIALPWKP